jgi:hypothetical protein
MEGFDSLAKVVDDGNRVLTSVRRMVIGINVIGVLGGRLRFIP